MEHFLPILSLQLLLKVETLKKELYTLSMRLEELDLKEKNAIAKVKVIEKDIGNLSTDRNAKLKDVEVKATEDDYCMDGLSLNPFICIFRNLSLK